MKKKLPIREMWGDDGPYSQAQLITEVRILNDSISRTFVIVSVNINPFTMKFVRKHLDMFKGDQMVAGIALNAEYRGPKDGYCVYIFQGEYIDEDVMKEGKAILKETNKAIIRMHQFVMDNMALGGKTKKQNGVKDDRERMFATQRLLAQTFIDRYLKETGQSQLTDSDEANKVLNRAIGWWNGQLTRDDRLRIEALPRKEQIKTFMEANVDLSGITGKVLKMH